MHPLTLSNQRIIIGSFAEATISIPSLEQEHLIIECNAKGEYVAINHAQDPFTSLNNLPFGKKTIHPGDCIVIQDFSFQILAPIAPPEIEKIPEPLEPNIAPNPLFEDQSWIENDLEVLLKAAEALEDPVLEEEAQLDFTPFKNEIKNDPKTIYKQEKQKNKNSLLIIFCALTTFLFSSICLMLLWMAHIIHQEDELTAAKNVADIGMALLYESMISPSGTSTLDSNLPIERVLARRMPSYGTLYPSKLKNWIWAHLGIHAANELSETPYLVDLHFSNDGSRFLLIARPNSSFWPSFLLKWLSKSNKKAGAIILDSKEMMLRQTDTLIPFDRFFQKNPLISNDNTNELERLIETSSVIPLVTLGSEFNPLNIKGSHRLYNLPRYYLFSETLSKYFNNRFASLPNIVIFSTKGNGDLKMRGEIMKEYHLPTRLFHVIFDPYQANTMQILETTE